MMSEAAKGHEMSQAKAKKIVDKMLQDYVQLTFAASAEENPVVKKVLQDAADKCEIDYGRERDFVKAIFGPLTDKKKAYFLAYAAADAAVAACNAAEKALDEPVKVSNGLRNSDCKGASQC
jgi:hypothetical protein